MDVNVVAYYFIEGDKTLLAREVMRVDSDWRLPSLWRHEYLNILATYTRRGGATLAQARIIWRRALELLAEREEPADAEAALALATQHPISTYDGQYVALAQRLRISLITADQRLVKAFPGVARTMESFVAAEPNE
ncbi:MAG: type II toxin-antitoxin system VapC family toxin [Betaproteobacteria bacterium]